MKCSIRLASGAPFWQMDGAGVMHLLTEEPIILDTKDVIEWMGFKCLQITAIGDEPPTPEPEPEPTPEAEPETGEPERAPETYEAGEYERSAERERNTRGRRSRR